MRRFRNGAAARPADGVGMVSDPVSLILQGVDSGNVPVGDATDWRTPSQNRIRKGKMWSKSDEKE